MNIFHNKLFFVFSAALEIDNRAGVEFSPNVQDTGVQSLFE